MRNLSYQLSTDEPPPGIAYYDIPAKNGAGLLARITITDFGEDGWHHTTSVHCGSVFVTDLDAYITTRDQIRTGQVDRTSESSESSDQGRGESQD